MRKLNIAIFSAFFPFRGGIAQFNARLFRSLEKMASVETYTFNKQYPNWLFPGKTQFVTDQDKADPIPAQRVVSTFAPWTYVTGARKLAKTSPDVFIANYWMTIFVPMFIVFNWFLPKKSKRIVILHNLIPHEKRFFDRFLNKQLVRLFDGFVVMSDTVRDELLSLRSNAKFLQLEHPWYDHFGHQLPQNEAKKMLNLDEDKKTVLFFGIIRAYKGLDLLIEAFDALGDDYQLVIAGEIYGNDNQYEQMISSMSSKKRIHLFNRYISDEEVNVFFSASDVCVLPYRSATQSGVTATAFHFNVPIIATPVGGLPQTIGHEEKGLLTDAISAVAIANTLSVYFAEGWKPRCQEAITVAKSQHSWDHFAKELLDFSIHLNGSDLNTKTNF